MESLLTLYYLLDSLEEITPEHLGNYGEIGREASETIRGIISDLTVFIQNMLDTQDNPNFRRME